jgi:hypothetical protein
LHYLLLFVVQILAALNFFDNLLQKGVTFLTKDKSEIWAGFSENSIISKLKETLQVGLGKAADYSSKADGYLGNSQMKIPMPEKIKTWQICSKILVYKSPLMILS